MLDQNTKLITLFIDLKNFFLKNIVDWMYLIPGGWKGGSKMFSRWKPTTKG